jgi:hypothetical protein
LAFRVWNATGCTTVFQKMPPTQFHKLLIFNQNRWDRFEENDNFVFENHYFFELECSHSPGTDKLLNAEHVSTPFNHSGASDSHIYTARQMAFWTTNFSYSRTHKKRKSVKISPPMFFMITILSHITVYEQVKVSIRMLSKFLLPNTQYTCRMELVHP